MKKSIFTRFLLLLIISLFAFSCQKTETEQIPFVVRMIHVHTVPNVKKGFDVIINQRLNEAQLADVARKIYETNDGDEYAKFFINYYLEGQTIGNISYASSHFTPDFEVKIYGMSQQYKEYIEDMVKAKRPFWIDEACPCLVKIEKLKGFHMMKRATVELGKTDITYDLIQLNPKVVDGDTLFYKVNSDVGEYYKFNSVGNIESYDNQGLIDTFLKD